MTAIIGIMVSLLFMVILVGVSVAAYKASKARGETQVLMLGLLQSVLDEHEERRLELQREFEARKILPPNR